MAVKSLDNHQGASRYDSTAIEESFGLTSMNKEAQVKKWVNLQLLFS